MPVVVLDVVLVVVLDVVLMVLGPSVSRIPYTLDASHGRQ